MQTSTHVNNVEVVARERATAPHPNPSQNGRIVEIGGVTKVLLADGTELFECDECGKSFDRVQSTVSHMGSHNPNSHKPDYAPEVIRTVIRAVRRYEHKRNKCELAAEELNAKNIVPLRTERWTGMLVSSLYNRYKDVYKVRVRRIGDDTPTTVTKETSRTKSQAQTQAQITRDDLLATVDQLSHTLDQAASALQLVRDGIASLPEPVEVDPEIVVKAAKWDAAQSLFSGK